jgi:hypothetical protein
VSQGLGRPLIGLASDSFGRINVAALGTLVAGLSSLLLWIPAGKFLAGAIVFSFFGCVCGCLWATVAPVCAEVIGLQMLPSGKPIALVRTSVKSDTYVGLSVLWVFLTFPAAFSTPIGVNLRKPGIEGYVDPQLFTGFVYIAAFLSGRPNLHS